MPKDMAHHGQQEGSASDDSSNPIISTTNPPSGNLYASKASAFSSDQSFTPDSLISEYSTRSSKAAQYSSLRGSGAYPIPQPSYPLYYNSSLSSGPTAAYGAARSSGYPWNNDTIPQRSTGVISAPSITCNCPPPSTVTVQNTITLPPITATVTSTVTASSEIPPSITPTVTITLTTTVCAGKGQNTGIGNSAPSAAGSSGGGQGSGAGSPKGDLGSTLPVVSGPGPTVQTSPIAPNIGNSELLPQATGSGSVTQPYLPPFANGTGAPGPSVPVGTGGFVSKPPSENAFPTSVQTQPASPPGSLEQINPPSSEGLGSGGAATSTAAISTPASMPTNNAPVISSGQGIGQTSVNIEQPQTSIQYPSVNTTSPSEGQGPANTQVIPSISSTRMPSIVGTNPNSFESSSTGASVTPPYGFGNNTSISPGPATGSNIYGTSPALGPPAQTSTPESVSSGLPPFVNTKSPPVSTVPLGTGIPYQPVTNTASARQSSSPPWPWTFSPAPFQTPPYPVAPDNSTSTTQGVNIPAPTGSSILTSQMPLNSTPVYITMTKEVSPAPSATTANNSSMQKSYGKFYGSGNPNSNSNSDLTIEPGAGSSLRGATTLTKDETALPTSPQTTPPETDVPILTTSSSPTPPIPPMTGTPIPSSPALPSNPIPNTPAPPPSPPPGTTTPAPSLPAPPSSPILATAPSPPPPPPSSSQNTTSPACNPTPTDTFITAD
ncbi:MAG: hypothetical protein Q9225_005752, partial [Loekoesia sp. 1 TL-2023]